VRGPVIPVFSRRLSMAADVASVQFSRTVERRITPAGSRVLRSRRVDVYPRAPADAGLSKLNSMLDLFVAVSAALPK
jgi:ribosomal protein L18E